MQFPGRSPSVGDGHAQSPTMGLSHCRCQDQWTARTLWIAKAAREAETNLCKRRSSAPPTASASGTFSSRQVCLVDSADSSRVKVGVLFGSNLKLIFNTT